MKIIDISWPIDNGITEYKDKKTVVIQPVKTFEQHAVRETFLQFGSHTGTHADAPSHFLQDGITIDKMPLDCFIGPAIVLDCTDCCDRITASDLEIRDIPEGKIVLLKTQNSFIATEDTFHYDAVYLAHSGADYLRQRGAKTVGIDYLGIERNQPNHETHKLLLSEHIGIVEGLRLGHVPAGTYFFTGAPIAIQNSDAAPVRALLLSDIEF